MNFFFGGFGIFILELLGSLQVAGTAIFTLFFIRQLVGLDNVFLFLVGFFLFLLHHALAFFQAAANMFLFHFF